MDFKEPCTSSPKVSSDIDKNSPKLTNEEIQFLDCFFGGVDKYRASLNGRYQREILLYKAAKAEEKRLIKQKSFLQIRGVYGF